MAARHGRAVCPCRHNAALGLYMAFQGKEIRYNTAQLECGLSELVDSGVTRLFVNDSLLTGTKKIHTKP